jgi:hypothetical protein
MRFNVKNSQLVSAVTHSILDGKLCDVKTKAVIASEKHIWTTELIIPMKCLTRNFDRNADWRLNLFRIEGSDPHRFYSAWRPTNTERPNFHVPEVFGTLKFSHD